MKEGIVLIVEDNIMNVRLFQEYFSRLNIENLVANDGETAIRLVQQHENISLIFMDIGLPGMDGQETMKIIRKLGINIPVIAQTAYVLNEHKSKYHLDEFDDFLSKPINFNKLDIILQKYYFHTITG